MSKSKPKQKTEAQIEAAKKRAIARELKLKVNIEKNIHARSENRQSIAKTKLQAYKREAQINIQTPTAKYRLSKEWTQCKNKTIAADGFFVRSRTVPCPSLIAQLHPKPESHLETWKVCFKAPSYSNSEFLQATVYFSIDYPFSSPIINFDGFSYPHYELDCAVAQTVENAFRSLMLSFDDDEYFYMSNGPNSIKSRALRNEYAGDDSVNVFMNDLGGFSDTRIRRAYLPKPLGIPPKICKNKP